MQTNQTPPDFIIDPIAYISFYWNSIAPYMLLTVQLILVLLVYIILVRLTKRSMKAAGMGSEASTGVTIVIRIVFFIIALMAVVTYLEPSLGTIVSISAIFGTAFGLAFSQALSNIVSGLYVLAARPFKVGDYVRIGSIEGIVREITLNYTKILLPDETKQLVPNSKVLTSEVTNFRISISEVIQEKEEEKTNERRSYLDRLDCAWEELKELAKDDDAYRYTFDLTIHMSYDHLEIARQFDKVCEKWESIFLIRPTYCVWSKPSAAPTYRFAFIVKKPIEIIQNSSTFLRELLAGTWISHK